MKTTRVCEKMAARKKIFTLVEHPKANEYTSCSSGCFTTQRHFTADTGILTKQNKSIPRIHTITDIKGNKCNNAIRMGKTKR